MKKRWQVKKITEEFLLDVLCDSRRFERYMNIWGLDNDGLIKLIAKEFEHLEKHYDTRTSK